MPRPKDPNSKRSQIEAAKAAKQKEREAAELKQKLEALEKENEKLKAQQSAPAPAQPAQPAPAPEATPITDEDVLDLTDLLGLEEEELAPPSVPEQETAPISDPENDFEEVPEPEPAESASDAEPSQAENMSAQYTSDFVISILDKVNGFLGEYAYNMAAFAPKEAVWLKHFAGKAANSAKKGKIAFDMSDEEIELLHAYEKSEEFKRRAPFTKEEKEMLGKPLTQMFKDSGKGISPQKAFIIALLVIMTARAFPIYMAYNERKERASREPEAQNDPETDIEVVEAVEVD
jgi:hypothetical protein